MEIRVREATNEDIPSLRKLCDVLGFYGEEHHLSQRLFTIRSLDYHNLLVSLNEKGSVTGFVHFFEAPSLLTVKTVEIGGLAVFKEQQRRGYGKSLMVAVEEWSINRNCKSILLATNIIREEAIDFYQSIGYQKEFQTYFMRKDVSGSPDSKLL